jgi:hypothetical protein
MNIMGDYGFYCGFSSFEQLVESITILLMVHVQLVLAVGCNI